MKLPHKSELSSAEFSGCVLGKRSQVEFGEVYVTCGSGIKNSEDMQQGTLAGTRFPYDSQHLTGVYLERQVFKEHQFRIARAENLLQILDS